MRLRRAVWAPGESAVHCSCSCSTAGPWTDGTDHTGRRLEASQPLQKLHQPSPVTQGVLHCWIVPPEDPPSQVGVFISQWLATVAKSNFLQRVLHSVICNTIYNSFLIRPDLGSGTGLEKSWGIVGPDPENIDSCFHTLVSWGTRCG